MKKYTHDPSYGQIIPNKISDQHWLFPYENQSQPINSGFSHGSAIPLLRPHLVAAESFPSSATSGGRFGFATTCSLGRAGLTNKATQKKNMIKKNGFQ